MPISNSNYIPLDRSIFVENNDLNNLKKYVLRQLGWPLIRVEITDEQLYDCIFDAVELYQEYAAIDYSYEELSVSGNQAIIPETINPKFIYEVIFPRDYFDSLSAGLASSGYEATLGGVLPYDSSGRSPLVDDFDIAQYFLYMQHMEDFKKIIGMKKSWEIIDRKIHIFPASSRINKIGLIYKGMLNEKSISSTSWIKSFAVAKAKIIVGTIRSKLGGFSSTGTNIAVDGEALKSEGREDVAALKERLYTIGIPMPFMQG
jgi:hypothetical protein